MSAFFSYAVDGDTARACLALIERAAGRATRGEAIYVAEKAVRGKQRLRVVRPRASRLTPERRELARQILALQKQGMGRAEIRQKLNVPEGVIDKIIYCRRKWIKELR